MSVRNHLFISISIVLVIFGLLLIPAVSAGCNIVTSSTGKLIITPWVTPSTSTTVYRKDSSGKWFTFSGDSVSLVPPPPTIEELYGYNASSTACGINGCSGTGDSLEGQFISRFWAPPANYPEITKTTPVGNPFIKPYANVSIYYPETSTASGLTNSFGGKGFFSSY